MLCPAWSVFARLSIMRPRRLSNWKTLFSLIENKQVKIFYPIDIQADIVDPKPLLRAIVKDIENKISPGLIAARFHNSIVHMLVEVSMMIRKTTGSNTVALSGGVWQNLYLLKHAIPALQTAGFTVLSHHHVPANDGCIALGQAMIANKQLQ